MILYYEQAYVIVDVEVKDMNQDKMYLVNRIFNNETIRTVWDKEEEKYYISIVDLVGVLSESDRPRKYLSDLKSKLKQEGNEVSEKIGQLRLRSQDGKYRLTDACLGNKCYFLLSML